MSLSAGTRIGPYEVTGSLGAGGMGEVYRARDTKLDRGVALKILPPSFANDPDRLMRFEREAKTLAALNHPCIAQIYGLEQSGQASTLVMELVEGEDLAQRLARGPVPLDEALPIARQIAEALEAAHEAGIVHRDLKPANIKVRPDCTVKVLDFGLAKTSNRGSGIGEQGSGGVASSPTITSPAATMHGTILGTAAYMSPEQAKGKPVDRRADIWAFGCVVYEMLTGQRAFEAEDVTDTIAAVVTKEPDWTRLPASTPASVERLLRRCLQKQIANRLPHIGVARIELADPGTDEIMTPLSSPARPRVGHLATAALAGISAAAVVAWLVWPSPSTDAAPAPMQLAVPGLDPESGSNGVLLSPNGRYLVTRGSAGASVLHALDGSPSRPLDGTALCWSPDSRSLVLRRGAGGDLLKMDLDGGPAVAFTKGPVQGAVCTWSRQGVLLLAGREFSRVTISDGTPIPVEFDDDIAVEQRLGPRFLSDGRRFLYWAVTADGQRTVRVGTLDSRETRAIVASDAPAVYSRGYLLFQRGPTLVAQPFDERSLTLSGEAQAITSEGAPGGVAGLARFDVSETGMLALWTTNGGHRGQANWVDRQGDLIRTLSAPADTELLNPEVSPDGLRVAGTRMNPATGNWDIWVVDVRTGESTRVTRQPGVDSDPMWSPDASELVYVSRRADVQGIFRMALADGREQLLMKLGPVIGGVTDVRPTGWSGDRRFVLVHSAAPETGYNILALPVAGGEPIPALVTPGREVNGRVSSDGRWLAYQSNDSGEDHIYIRPFLRPGRPTRVSSVPGAIPQWGRDGQELFWQGPAPEARTTTVLYSAELTIAGDNVRVGAPKRLFPLHVHFDSLIDNRRQWAAAPDGRHFVLRQATGLQGSAVKVILNWQGLLRGR
jgi:eukaryotic-like serine/threonine-protein kinase